MKLQKTHQNKFSFKQTKFNYKEASLLLNNLSNNENDFNSDTWLIGKHSRNTLNFSLAFKALENFPKWLNNQDHNPIVIIKLLLLYSYSKTSTDVIIRYRFEKLLKVYYYLASNNKNMLMKRDLNKFFKFMLTKNLTKNIELPILDNHYYLSYSSFKSGLLMNNWIFTLKALNIQNCFWNQSISKKIFFARLKKYINESNATDLTFNDWKTSKSHNYLTLDYGVYYIEHCNNFFQKHFVQGIAIERTLEKTWDFIEYFNLDIKRKNSYEEIKYFMGKFLTGQTPDEYIKKHNSKYSRIKFLEKLYDKTIETYTYYYTIFKRRQLLLEKKCLILLADSMNFDITDTANYEWFKIVIETIYEDNYFDKNMTPVKLIEAREKWLNDHVKPILNTSKLIKLIEKNINSIDTSFSVELINLNDITNSNFNWPNTSSFPLLYFRRAIKSAGLTSFVALTGWRASEFGFSIQNLDIKLNQDIFDQKSHPFRYHVSWKANKTHGNKNVLREISEGTFQVLRMLSHINYSYNNEPCLYSRNKNIKKTINYDNSKTYVQQGVSTLWLNYVYHYPPYIKIDRQIMNDDPLNYTANELGVSKNLLSAYSRSRKEINRLLPFSLFTNNKSIKNTIWQYKNKGLSDNISAIYDLYLSTETKHCIQNFNKISDISRSFVRDFSREIKGDSLYPTPHAFRHIWAESVYRRFDGDVGWMIRSQFKHITSTMWLSYIRDKDNNREHDKAKLRTISTILFNYLSKNTDNIYSGNINKYLRRVFKSTKITSITNLEKDVLKYVHNEFEDIKANPWSYCLLKKKSKHRAKCSVNNIPNRQNASVSFCLECPNSLSQSGNIPGIISAISNDIEIVKSPGVPTVFSQRSYQTLKMALKHLLELKADSLITDEIISLLIQYEELNP